MPLVRYRPSGLYEPAALWAVPLLLAVGIAILSIPYALYDVAYMAKRPVDDHNIGTFVPMIWITFSLFYAMALIFLFKIRNFKVAVILTCIGAFVGYVLHWLVLYYFSDSGLGFFDFVCERVHSGIWVHYRHYGVYLEKGGFLVFAWVMEFMALMAAVGYLVPGEPVSILFSEKFNDWYKWINLRRDVYANFGQSLANLLQEGDIRYLLTAKIAKKKEPSLSLRLYFSPKPWQSFVSIRSVSKFPPQWERAVPKNDGCVWVIPISDEDAERLRKKFS